jgi:hypothetical protein
MHCSINSVQYTLRFSGLLKPPQTIKTIFPKCPKKRFITGAKIGKGKIPKRKFQIPKKKPPSQISGAM